MTKAVKIHDVKLFIGISVAANEALRLCRYADPGISAACGDAVGTIHKLKRKT